MKAKKLHIDMLTYFPQGSQKWQTVLILKEQVMRYKFYKRSVIKKKKKLDQQGRWRNKTVSFRVSPEENKQIETAVKLSGMSKQDFIICCLQKRKIEVIGNPKVYKALKNELANVLNELNRIEAGNKVSQDLLDTINLITITIQGMRNGK